MSDQPPAKPAPSWWRQHRWAIGAALLVFTGCVVLGWRWWQGPVVPVDAVVRRDFVQTVVASGRVEAPHRVDIGAQITGTVQQVPVEEGERVHAGQLLISLESAELAAATAQADAAAAQAQARLRRLREVQAPVGAQSVRQAQAALVNANTSLGRSQALFAQGFVGRAALDDARKVAELADAEVRSAQMQLDSLGRTGSDTALAVADVASADANAHAARARAGYAVIVAPLAGTLIGRSVEPGDVVQPGKVLMTLSPAGRTQLVVQIDEKNLRLLALGQPARVSADAYPQERFDAVLSYVNPGVNAQTGAVEVKLDVPQPPPVLKQDMTVSVDIEVARRPAALVVPATSVRDADGAAPWVLRIEGRHAVRRALRIGLRSGGVAEVLEGLAEGDRVVTMSAKAEAGARVRAAAVANP